MGRRRWYTGFAWLCSVLAAAPGAAQLATETVGTSTLTAPAATWFVVRDVIKGPGYVFDAATGDMLGLLSLTTFTPAVEVNHSRGEIYAAESYYARGTHGERTDVLTIYDLPTLSPREEVKLPPKLAALPFRQYIGLLGDGRHVGVFNITPAFSVSIVDVVERTFVGEISTPGCALILPTEVLGFLQLCGDGTAQLVRLEANGEELKRQRSRVFFDLNTDPVFDKSVPTDAGWLLMSYLGQVFELTSNGQQIDVTAPWSILSAADQSLGWRPGGGQFLAFHRGLGLLFVLMNPGGEFAHDHAGTEIWVYRLADRRRVHRTPIPYSGSDLVVSQDDAPLLTVTGDDGLLHVYDVATMAPVRSIAEAGVLPGHLQGF